MPLIANHNEYIGLKEDLFPNYVSSSIGKHHFVRWLALFRENMPSLFDGPVAEETIRKAESIGYIFQNKLAYIHSADKVK